MLESWFMELADCCQKGYRYQSLTLIIIYMLACIKSEVDSLEVIVFRKSCHSFVRISLWTAKLDRLDTG